MSQDQATRTAPPAFGTVFAPTMPVTRFVDGRFAPPTMAPSDSLALHPGAHALHYGSACFEGLKAHRGDDGVVRLFRADRHVERMRRTASLLCLPVPEADLLFGMIESAVAAHLDLVPEPPGSLYLRPALIGTEPNIGAAAAPSQEALLYVLASPVGDYFAGGMRPLSLAIETDHPRTTPQFGAAKCGANYVMALGITREAKRRHGVDQVLFAPDGDVQETGASNFLLIDDERVVTKALDDSFLHGVTRDSVLRLAGDLGYRVEERAVSVDEVLTWARHGEAALSGTAAVLSAVGRLIHDGHEIVVKGGEVGANTQRLRTALSDVQTARAPDQYGWTHAVTDAQLGGSATGTV